MEHQASDLRGHNSGHLFERLGAIEYAAIDALHPYANNPRRATKKQLVKLSAAIAQFGFVVPILADEHGEIIAGETRWLCAKELGLKDVPVIRLGHLTDAQIKAFRIADNRLGELSEWDKTRLASEYVTIIEMGEVEIDLTGFETAEIDLLIESMDGGEGQVEAADPDDEQPDPAPAISMPGDMWTMGEHRLLCGSSRDPQGWARLMDGKTAAMVFTDPPYNVSINGHVSGSGKHKEFAEASGEMTKSEFIDFLAETIGNASIYLRDGGIADICMDHAHLPELYAAVERCGLKLLNLCVWNKTNGGMGSLYRSKHELVLVIKKGKAPHTNNVQLGKHGRYRTNVWDYAGVNSFGKNRKADLADHPTVKPTALVADAIRDVTDAGDIVIDAFMGSGTTLLAAERTKRIAYGMEIDGTYVDVAIRRWEQRTGQQAILVETGETFAEVRACRSRDDASVDDEDTEAPPAAPAIRVRPRPQAA